MGLKKKGRAKGEREGRRKERKFKRKEGRCLITENFRPKIIVKCMWKQIEKPMTGEGWIPLRTAQYSA